MQIEPTGNPVLSKSTIKVLSDMTLRHKMLEDGLPAFGIAAKGCLTAEEHLALFRKTFPLEISASEGIDL